MQTVCLWVAITSLVGSTALAAPPDAARLREALALEPTDGSAALAALDALVLASPGWELPRLENARLRLKRGEGLGLAELHLEAARSWAPENPRAHFLWGTLMEEQRNALQAAAAYELALTVRPAYDEARFRLAGLYFSLGNFKASAHAYRRYLQTHPEVVGARLQLAAAAERSGGTKEAEQELMRLFEQPTSRQLAGRRLAELYERTGQRQAAAKIRAQIEAPPRKLRELKRSGR